MLASLVHARGAERPTPQHPARAAPPAAPLPTMELGAELLLDLSFLTEEEQCAIAEVLHRDWVLRQREEGRVSELRKSMSDLAQLWTLTGDWFCEARAQRHQHHHLGSDLVRASIRRRRRPQGEPELGPSLEAIAEPLVEEKEDDDGGGELEERPLTEVPAAAAPQPSPTAPALTGTPEPQQHRDSPGREQHIPALPGDTANGRPLGTCSTEEDEEELHSACYGLGAGEGLGTPPVLPPQNGHAPRSSLLSTSSSVSSLSSSTLSSSLMSLYSEGELCRVPVRGWVQLSLRYEPGRQELQVHVLRCRELAQARKQRSDPYIKTYLLPDKSNRSKRKTTVRKRSLDPIFNETLKYKLDKRELQGRTLNLSVWHHDSLGRNLFLGEVEIALCSWDWDNTSPEWFSLQPRVPVSSDGLASRGSLNLALKFIPAGLEGGGLPPTGELHIWVKDAQSLVPLQSGTVDAFVQCYVLPDDSKASRQKTRVVKRSLNPLFNHTMVYDGFQAKDLAEACAEFTLWHHEAFSKRQLGGIRLSLGTGSSYGLPVGWMDSTAEERAVWGRLLQQPGQWVEALLPLRTNLVPRA
ncbi:synaptotagmin-like protein 1 [Melopsittacus undulatus]|uniref:Synaptotagmin-like protein 1 n=1 Tax=Melopsittacus undulatus TaxID=13146 RepID=A0A8V5HEY3_MELUD|nr:synaptotagmin-like protein 1 [Melopsittacus undulatus]XP_033925315.1 synaptotagmin-like protein 1 [Melopsittacus undulatus]XP_033925316.1 synaptotagmin-like protein 1 [Melopsittacus undulatus]